MAEDDNELKRRYMRWSGQLQEAYLEALEECGGLNEARPKALLDLLQPRFPFLTLQASRGAAVAAGPPLGLCTQLCDWCRCHLRWQAQQTEYGQLLFLAHPNFFRCFLQNVKNHLQKQRTKEVKDGAGGCVLPWCYSSCVCLPVVVAGA